MKTRALKIKQLEVLPGGQYPAIEDAWPEDINDYPSDLVWNGSFYYSPTSTFGIGYTMAVGGITGGLDSLSSSGE